MADLTVKLIWYRLREGFSNMAERLDGLSNWDEYIFGDEIDILNILLIGWILLAAAVVILTNLTFKFLYPELQSPQSSRKLQSVETEISSPSSSALYPAVSDRALAGEKPIIPQVQPQSFTAHVRTIGLDAESCQWVNSVLNWLYMHYNNTPEFVDAWIKALNEHSKRYTETNDVSITFDRVLSNSLPPRLSNVVTEAGPGEHMTILCKVESTELGFLVQASQKIGNLINRGTYDVAVEKLNGQLLLSKLESAGPLQLQLRVDNHAEDLFISAFFESNPEIKVSAKPHDIYQKNNINQEQLEEAIRSNIAKTVTNINLANFIDFPRPNKVAPLTTTYQVREPEPKVEEIKTEQTEYKNSSHPFYQLTQIRPEDQRLLVKIIKATGLGTRTGCQEPYCVVEMDDPPQKHKTTIVRNTNNPFWDEHFLFDLSGQTSEILFEVFDTAKIDGDNFLGLAIVSLDELQHNPSHRQIIPLQSHPMKNDDVSGCLTVEFLFMEAAEILPNTPGMSPKFQLQASPSKRIETSRTVTPGGTVITTTTTTITKPLETQINGVTVSVDDDDVFANVDFDQQLENTPSKVSRTDSSASPSVNSKTHLDVSTSGTTADEVQETVMVNGVESVVNTALKELNEPKPKPPGQTTSTLIITSVQRSPSEGYSSDGDRDSVAAPGTPNSKAEVLRESRIDTPEDHKVERRERSRSQSRERKSLLGQLKRKFSFRKGRSKSLDRQEAENSLNNQEMSGDRSKSVPGSREPSSTRSASNAYLEVPGARSSTGSPRSSISDASAISGSSSRTYHHEASTLVIETAENNVRKHYLIPATLARTGKYRKKGIKLHVYNDHTFIATHISGSVACQVCSRSVPRRIGKQGYQCRDCKLVCHKHCHVKTEIRCPNSTVSTMEMEYVSENIKTS